MTVRAFVIACLLTTFTATGAQAEPPAVVADTPPAYALTAMVMDGVGAPELLLSSGASAHDYSLRPSEARMLQEAELVIWVGPGLTPWLADPIDALSDGASRLTLLDVPGTLLLPVRTDARFETDDHDHGHDHNDTHGEDDGEGHDHGHDESHDDDHGDSDAHDHDDGAIDPHAWLDPENAIVWTRAIAERLSTLDPANTSVYMANLAKAEAKIRATEETAMAGLKSQKGNAFIVFHDAYQYFEAHFGLNAAGAIALHDATAPSARRLAELQNLAAEAGVSCVLSEAQFDPGLAAALAEGNALKTGVADPLGTELPIGPDLYFDLITGLADVIADCVGE